MDDKGITIILEEEIVVEDWTESIEPIEEEKEDDEFSPWPSDNIEFRSKSDLEKEGCSLIKRAATQGKYTIKKRSFNLTVDAGALIRMNLAKPSEKEKKVKEVVVEKDLLESKEYTLEEKEKNKEMLDKYTFTMYNKKPHSAQDAYPYLDEELMVVCDGLGGGGATIHEIDDYNKFDTYEKLSKIVLPEDKDYSLKDFFIQQFEEILNSPSTPRASAYWASRILIVNFVYAFKNITHNPNKLKDFCSNALNRFKKTFKLVTSGATSQRVLPSTLTAIWIKEESEESVKVSVMWAGDSRASILSSDGYKPISKDHEDEKGGAMNNLFYAGNDKCFIESKDYEFKKPCILVAASDGTFDDRDDWFIEKIFFDSIMKGNDINAIKKNFEEEYVQEKDGKSFVKHGKPDDTTIAFRMFGYTDVEDLKSKLSNRYSYINNIYDIYSSNVDFNKLEAGISDLEEGYNALRDNDIKRHIEEISSIFADELASGICEDIIPSNIASKANEYIAKKVEENKAKYEKVVREVSSKVIEDLEFSDNTPSIDEVLDITNPTLDKLCKDNGIVLIQMKNDINDFKSFNELVDSFKEDSTNLSKEVSKLGKLIKGLAGVSRKLSLTYVYEPNTSDNVDCDVELANDDLELLNSIGYTSLVETYNKAKDDIKQINEKRRGYSTNKEYLESKKNDYETIFSSFKRICTPNVIYESLTSEYKKAIDLEEVSKNDILEIIINNMDDNAIDEIRDLVIKHKINDSSIKIYINDSRLKNSILYMGTITNPKIVEAREEYYKLKSEYDSKLYEFIG